LPALKLNVPRVYARLRFRLLGEDLADRIEGADVARRRRARGPADGRLIDQHRVVDAFVPGDGFVRAGHRAGTALEFAQRAVEYAFDERGFARATDAGNHHQPVQRQLDVDAFEIVCGRAADAQALGGCYGRFAGLFDRALPLRHLAPTGKVVGSQRMLGVHQLAGRALEDQLAAALAGAGPDVEHPIGGMHDLRVVLDDQQRVAGVAQPVHDVDDAFHVARVQADAGFVEHEQRVDQRGAQRRGQVDALDLAAGQSARLAFEGEITQADFDQVVDARANRFEQQVRGGVQRGRQVQVPEQRLRARQRQTHDVGDVEPRLGLQRRVGEPRVGRLEARSGLKHRVSVFLRTHPPKQRLGLEPRTAARRAFVVRAVARQQHPDVHLVGARLQPVEETLHAVPAASMRMPAPLLVAVDNPRSVGLFELFPRHVGGHARLRAVTNQVVLALDVAVGLPGFDRAVGQRLVLVGDDQPVVDAHDPAEAAALLAGAHGRIEGEGIRYRGAVVAVAVGAVQALGIAPMIGRLAVVIQWQDADVAAAGTQRRFHRLGDAVAAVGLQPHAVLGHAQRVFVDGLDPTVALAVELGENLVGLDVAAQRQFESDHCARTAAAFDQPGDDLVGTLAAHLAAAALAEQTGGTREQQFQVVVELGHRADRRARTLHRVGLVDRDRRRDAVDGVHRRLVHPVQELARIRREGLDVAALALGVDGVERQRRLARAAGARDHGQRAQRQVDVEVLQVVLARAAQPDELVGHCRFPRFAGEDRRFGAIFCDGFYCPAAM